MVQSAQMLAAIPSGIASGGANAAIPALIYPSGDTSGATDAANIQAAVNKTNAWVHLAAGAYYVSSTVNLPSGTKLIGSGCGQIYNTTANNTVINAIGCTPIEITVGNAAGVIQDLQLNGAHATGAGYQGIYIPAAGTFQQCEWVISRVFIQGFTNASSNGIYYGGNNGGLYVFQCTVYNCHNGLNILGSDAVISNCLVVENLANGIINGGAVTAITGCSIGVNGLAGVSVPNYLSNPGGMIFGNGINQNGQQGIYLNAGGIAICGNNMHSNCTSSGNGDIEVANYGGTLCSITGNNFTGGSAPYSVYFDGAQVAAVAANSIASGASNFTNNQANCTAGGGVLIAQVAASANNPQTGASYTFVLADAGTEVDGNRATAQTFTVPPNSSVAFPLGTVISVRQLGAGQITIAAGAGVTLLTANAAVTRAQYSLVTITQDLATANTWYVDGDT